MFTFSRCLMTGLVCCAFTLMFRPETKAQEAQPAPLDAFIAREQLQHSFRPAEDLWQNDPVDPRTAEHYVNGAQFLQLNKQKLAGLMADKSKGLRLSLPDGKGSHFEIDLARFDIFARGFTVQETSGERTAPVAYSPGLYYRGTVRGIPGSLAAFSLFNNEVYGMFSIPGQGNFSITPNTLVAAGLTEHYILYNDNDLKIRPNADACRSDELDVKALLGKRDDLARASLNSCKDVEVFLQADYATFLSLGSSTTHVADYLSSVFNALSVLYRNEGVYTSIKTIHVNTATDAYQQLASNAQLFLNKFGQLAPVDLGGADVGHLVSTRYAGNMGGIAWLDVLCASSFYYAPLNYYVGPYAFSNFLAGEAQGTFPTYTWNVECMTHEMGHNLGSQHTHNCNAWNGGPIDGCGPMANPAYTEGVCAPGPIPAQGTIMSYCHLLAGVGISFANGFGQQPGDLIRSRVAGAACADNYLPDTVLSSASVTQYATRECTDAAGITYYWNDNDNADETDNQLVLRMKKNANNIGTLDDPGFAVTMSTLPGYGSNSGTAVSFPAGTSNAGGIYPAMNRYWAVTPISQPTGSVEVQFPFTQQDITDAVGTMASPSDYTALRFYKVAEGADPDPTSGLTGATPLNTRIYTYSTGAASADTWTSSVAGNTRLAHFLVTSFTGGGGFGADGAPLPLQLISFKGVLKGNTVTLDWKTADEKNIREYILERSADAVHYEPLSIVAARNGANVAYNTIDKHPAEGSNYYRLSLVTTEGLRQVAGYTQVSVHNRMAINIYPNPAATEVHVGITGDRAEAMALHILDLQGRVVVAAVLQAADNVINLQSLPEGMYIVQVSGSRETVRQKLMVR